MARAVSLEIGLNAPMTGLHAGSSEIRHIYHHFPRFIVCKRTRL